MEQYAVIYENGPDKWSADPPVLPRCATTGDTFDECRLR